MHQRVSKVTWLNKENIRYLGEVLKIEKQFGTKGSMWCNPKDSSVAPMDITPNSCINLVFYRKKMEGALESSYM